MKKRQTSKGGESIPDDMLPEYEFDYQKARPNRFATQINKDRPTVTLDSDIAGAQTLANPILKVGQ